MRSRNLLIVPVLAAVIAAGFTASARSRGIFHKAFVRDAVFCSYRPERSPFVVYTKS